MIITLLVNIAFYSICIKQITTELMIEDENTTKLTDHIKAQSNKFVAPPGKPLLVKIGYFIFGFYDISELNMDFTLSYYMRMTWVDSRLSFEPSHFGNISEVILHPEQMEKSIWRPDPFYRNEKGQSISKSFSVADSLSRVNSTGEVFLSRKLQTTFRCHMRLNSYPFDTQMCSMDIGSYAHTIDILHFGFIQSTPVEFYREIELTSFELKDFYAEKRNETFSTGTFPAVQIIFQLKRYVSFYILQVRQPESYSIDKMLRVNFNSTTYKHEKGYGYCPCCNVHLNLNERRAQGCARFAEIFLGARYCGVCAR